MKAASFGAFCALGFFASVAMAQNVKITPLGSHDGELCANDRATLFEDPTGVRILYDVGNTLTGADDPRLGTVHVVLLSHAHGDHIGDARLAALNAGTCRDPQLVSAAPDSMTAIVAAANLADEIKLLGPVKLKTVEEAQASVVRVIRTLEESGDIVMSRGSDELVV